MDRFVTHRGLAVSLPIKDIDTDLIIPAEFLTSTASGGYGKNLFRRLRDSQPDFVLNNPSFSGASILVADDNFGCGSSREHAVWALKEAGFVVVIAKSFADIFRSNSSKNGLLLIELPPKIVDELLEKSASPGFEIEVSLDELQVKWGCGESCEFHYDSFVRHCMLHGIDELDFILESRLEIEKYWKSRQESHYSAKAGHTPSGVGK